MSGHGYDVFPCVCVFPGCARPAPPADPDDLILCVDHERLRFYSPDEFVRGWEQIARDE